MTVHVLRADKSTRTRFDEKVRKAASGDRAARDPARNRTHMVAAFGAALSDDGRRSPWPHQADAIRAVSGHFERGGTNAICVIPTAGGKTEIFQRLVAAAHRSAGALDLRTVVLVPTRQLVLQTVDRFESEFPDLSVGYLGKGLGERWSAVMVMTYARFIGMAGRSHIAPADVDLIVMDEAHRGLSDLRQNHFRRFLGSALVTAFSATPVFHINKNIYNLLGSGNEVIHLTVADLIAERRIAPVVNVIVGVNLVGEMPDDPEVQACILKAAANRAMLDVRATQTFPDLGFSLAERTFVAYAWDIAHGCSGAAAFAAEHPGEVVRPISYLTDADAQKDAIKALSSRRISGIFNAMVLLEGTDIPSLGAVYNLAPTNSLVRQMQRCGRALRLDPTLHPEDPRQTGVVVDFFYRLNGRMLGRPVFYCDAIGDPTIARAIETAPVDFTPLLETTGDATRPSSMDVETAREAALARMMSDPGEVEDADDVESALSNGASFLEGAGRGQTTEHVDEQTASLASLDILQRLRRISIVSQVTDVVSITSERDRVRFGCAEEGLVGRTHIAIRIGVASDSPSVRPLFDGIEEEVIPLFRRDPLAVLSVKRNGIELEVCCRRVGYGQRPQYRLDQLDRFVALCEAALVDKGEEWINQTEIARSMGNRDPWRSAFKALIDEFSAKRRSMLLASDPVRRRLDAWQRTDVDPSAAEGAMPLRMELCRNGPTRVVCFHKDDLLSIRRMVGLDRPDVERRSEEWLGFGEITEALSLKSERVRRAFQAIAEIYDADRGSSLEERSIVYGGHTFRMCRVARQSHKTYPCIHADCLNDLTTVAGVEIVPPIDQSWAQRNEVATLCGCKPQNVFFLRAWNSLVQAFEEGRSTEISGITVRMERRRVHRTVLTCMARDDVGDFAKSLGVVRG